MLAHPLIVDYTGYDTTMERDFDPSLIDYLCSTIEALRILSKPTAMESVINLVELRGMIFAQLPLEALYRARKVCWDWRLQIDGSCQLQQLMYRKPMRGRRQEVDFHYLSYFQSMTFVAPTITINPILDRTIIIPRKGMYKTSAVHLQNLNYDAATARAISGLMASL